MAVVVCCVGTGVGTGVVSRHGAAVTAAAAGWLGAVARPWRIKRYLRILLTTQVTHQGLPK